METLIYNNCPADIVDEFKDEGYEEYMDKLANGTLTPQDIEDLKESIITSYECGATLRVEITTNSIDPSTLTSENTYLRLGWDHPDAFRAYGDDARGTFTDDDYGFALYKFGAYFILISGFPA